MGLLLQIQRGCGVCDKMTFHFKMKKSTETLLMTKLKMMGLYLALGPLVGGLAVFVALLLTIIIPDVLADPANQFGHDRIRQVAGLLALNMVFAYPLGLLSALAAGLAHIQLQPQFLRYRKSCIALVGMAGWLALSIQSLASGMLAPEILWVPWVSAGILSARISSLARRAA